MNYVRVKLQINSKHSKIIWAIKSHVNDFMIRYIEVKPDGDFGFGRHGNKRRVTYAGPADIIWEKPAHVSRKYGLLEIST